jgi:hypothetical protein
VHRGLVGAAVLLVLLAVYFDIALPVGSCGTRSGQRALSGFLPIGTVLVGSYVFLAALDAAAGRGDNLRLVTHGIANLGMIATWWLEAHAHRRPRPDVQLAA